METELISLSPSRAADFKACPQLFKFRVIDHLPEPSDPSRARGTLVHAVLERLCRLPAPERTIGTARGLLGEVWAELKERDELSGRTVLRGIIDRIEVRDDGEWILVDYKTGRAPSAQWALGSFFGLKFYALVCWRAFGKMPSELRLLQLGQPEVITLRPSAQMLEGLERQLDALGTAILRALTTGDWRPRPSWLCGHCAHQAVCPAWAATDGSPEELAG